MMGEYIVEIESDNTGYTELNYATIANPYLTVIKISHCYLSQNYEEQLYSRGIKEETYWCNPKIEATEATDTIFSNLTGGPNSPSGVELYTELNRCIFSCCKISSYQSASFNNCVFQGGNDSEWSYKGSLIFNQQYRMDYESNDYLYKSQDGSIYFGITAHGTSGEMKVARAIANALGGDIACIETKEELSFLQSSVKTNAYKVGLRFADDYWVNGTLVEQSIRDVIESYTTDYPSEKNSYLVLNAGGRLSWGWGASWLIEIPSENVTAQTKEELQEMINDIYNGNGS